MACSFDLSGQNIFISWAQGPHFLDILAHNIARDPAINRRVGHAIPAQPIRAMRAPCIFASHIQAFQRGTGVNIHHNPPHEIMRGGHNFDFSSGQIKPAICTAVDHALKFLAHIIWSKMRHRNEHALLVWVVVFADFGVNAAADNIARCPLSSIVIIEHEPLTCMRQQLATRAPQTFFQHGSGHTRMRAR